MFDKWDDVEVYVEVVPTQGLANRRAYYHAQIKAALIFILILLSFGKSGL